MLQLIVGFCGLFKKFCHIIIFPFFFSLFLQQLRKLVLEIIHRIPTNEHLRLHTKNILSVMFRFLEVFFWNIFLYFLHLWSLLGVGFSIGVLLDQEWEDILYKLQPCPLLPHTGFLPVLFCPLETWILQMQGAVLMLGRIFWQIADSWEFVFCLGIDSTLLWSSHGGLCLRGNGSRPDGAEWLKCLGFTPQGWI